MNYLRHKGLNYCNFFRQHLRNIFVVEYQWINGFLKLRHVMLYTGSFFCTHFFYANCFYAQIVLFCTFLRVTMRKKNLSARLREIASAILWFWQTFFTRNFFCALNNFSSPPHKKRTRCIMTGKYYFTTLYICTVQSPRFLCLIFIKQEKIGINKNER